MASQIFHMILSTFILATLSSLVYVPRTVIGQIEKVSGEDDNGENEGLFMALLGAKKSFFTESQFSSRASEFNQLQSSPSPTPEASIFSGHGHSHSHNFKITLARGKKTSTTEILITILSTAAIMMALAFYWFCHEFPKRQRTTPIHSMNFENQGETSKHGDSKVKVTLRDHLSFNSVAIIIEESHNCCQKQGPEIRSNTREEEEEEEEEVNLSSAHENPTIKEPDTHSSDYESSHSLYHSRSYTSRFYNASGGDSIEKLEEISPESSFQFSSVSIQKQRYISSSQNAISAPSPPPPPPQFQDSMEKGSVSVLPKLKPLHWDKVRSAPDRTMVWDKLKSSSFEFDEEKIESLFGYEPLTSLKNDDTKSQIPSPSKYILEPKRLQNLTILSKALNVSAEHVCDALLREDSGLCLQQLETLAKMVPNKDEEAKLYEYKGDISELGSAEKFLKAMLNVPLAFQRIDALIYRDTFEDEVVLLRKSFSVLEEACKELRSSRLFLKLLEAVLKTGNRMNMGTIRGGARAFKLHALLKLADVKGTDGKTTLLHFVVQEMIRSEGMRVSDSIMGRLSQKNKNRSAEEKEDDYRRMGLDLVSGLTIELSNVKKTASIDMDVITASVSNLSDGITNLQHLLSQDLVVEGSRGFCKSMRVFMSHGIGKLKELKEDEGKVLLKVGEITEYFHGDLIKEEGNPLHIFVIVRDFLGMLDNVCKEFRKSKQQRIPNPLAEFM